MNKQQLLTLAHNTLPLRFPELIKNCKSQAQWLGLFKQKLLSDSDFQAIVLLILENDVSNNIHSSENLNINKTINIHKLPTQNPTDVITLGSGFLKAAASDSKLLISLDWYNAAADQWYYNTLTFPQRRGKVFAQLKLAQGMLERIEMLQADCLQIIDKKQPSVILVEYTKTQLTQAILTAPWLLNVSPQTFLTADTCIELNVKR